MPITKSTKEPSLPRRDLPSPPPALVRMAEWRGLDALSPSQLIALLLGGASRAHLDQAEDLLEAIGRLEWLEQFTPEGLRRASGLPRSTALKLLAAVELGQRIERARQHADRPTGPLTKELVASWAAPRLAGLEHEEVWVLTVDARARLRSALRVGQGGAHGCALLPQDILTPVVRAGALGFVLVHNHPSGDPNPSPEDIALTNSVHRAAELIGAPLLDHVIVGRDGYRSLLEQGHLAA